MTDALTVTAPGKAQSGVTGNDGAEASKRMPVRRITNAGTVHAGGRRKRLTAAGRKLPFDVGENLGYGFPMTDDNHDIQQIIDYCDEKWVQANEPQGSTWPTPEMQLGRNMACNDVLQFARKLIGETS